MQLRKISPVLAVASAEDVLPFWKSLGFEVTVSVPHGERLGFAILVRAGMEVMVQSYDSLEADVPGLVDQAASRTFLYLEVDDLDAAVAGLAASEVVVPERTTLYGAREVMVREPGGHVVALAQFGNAGASE